MKLKEALQARDPATLIPPDLGPWAHDFARILRAGRKPDEVTEVMNWCLKDKFWAPVIVSGGVFVRNFDKMLGRMRQGDSTSSPAPIEEPGSDPDFEPVTTNDGRVKWRKKPPATKAR